MEFLEWRTAGGPVTMAWRPEEYLIEGELDNTVQGKVKGWVRFLGIDHPVHLDLDGDFGGDIRGARIRIRGLASGRTSIRKALAYMETFLSRRTGTAGDITAGSLPTDDEAPYIEWYSTENGRVILELLPEQLQVIGEPILAAV